MSITGRQAAVARKQLGWTQADLAAMADTSEWTLRQFEETDRRPPEFVVSAIRAALESGGAIFVA
jgi:ribosome-binding protein aMBF1 (putative translation factor)